MVEYSLNPLTAVPLVLSDSRAPHTQGFNKQVPQNDTLIFGIKGACTIAGDPITIPILTYSPLSHFIHASYDTSLSSKSIQ